jgi:acyl-CoA thioesterase FadM
VRRFPSLLSLLSFLLTLFLFLLPPPPTRTEYFDSLTNHFLLTRVPSSPSSSPRPLGLIVNSETTYNSSLSYPSPVLGALAVQTLSNRTVVWRVALFDAEYASEDGGFELSDVVGEGGRRIRLKGGEGARAAAYGTMTHVFVHPDTRKVVQELPEGLRRALEGLIVGEQGEK